MSRKYVLVAVVGVLMAVLLMSDVPPPPNNAHARLDRPFYYPHMDSYLWRAATDGDPQALDNSYYFWRLTPRVGSNAADSIQVKVREVATGDWKTITYPGGAVIGMIFDIPFYGPEIDSVEVFTGTNATCSLDGWYE